MAVLKPIEGGIFDGDPDWVNLHVCRRLKAKRILRHMTQERLAAAMGISYQQLQRYESGKSRLTCSLLYRAALALNVPIGYFFASIPCGDNDGPDPVVEKTALLIGRTVQNIPDAKIQRSLLALVSTLARASGGRL